MDPTNALEALRAIASRALKNEGSISADDVLEMAEYCDALDTWISNGGSLPNQWNRKVKTY